MWNPRKSVVASSICTKIMIGIIIGVALTAPFLVKEYISFTMKDPNIVRPLMATIYACAVPGLIAMFALNGLLENIKKKEVFIEKKCEISESDFMVQFRCIAHPVSIRVLLSFIFDHGVCSCFLWADLKSC